MEVWGSHQNGKAMVVKAEIKQRKEMPTAAKDTSAPKLIYTFFIRTLEVVSCLVSSLLIVANVLIAIQMVQQINSAPTAANFLLRVFNVLLALLVIVSYSDYFRYIQTHMFVLMTYVGIGSLHIFLAVLTVSASTLYEQLGKNSGQYSTAVNYFNQVSGYVFAGLGVIFVVMGIFQFPYLSKKREMLKISKSSLYTDEQV